MGRRADDFDWLLDRKGADFAVPCRPLYLADDEC
jgi:hypothetical protein